MAMEKVDRRIARTRKMLRDALVELSLKNGYDSISIRKLTGCADIGYATFYRHFKSKDELLSHVITSTIEDLKQAISKAESPRAEAVAMYRHISEDPQPFRLYITLPESIDAQKIIRSELANMFLERFKPLAESTIPLEVAVNHIIQSNFELLRWYLDNLDNYSAEQIADIYIDLVVRVTTSMSVVRRDEWLERFPPRQRDDNSQAIVENPSTAS